MNRYSQTLTERLSQWTELKQPELHLYYSRILAPENKLPHYYFLWIFFNKQNFLLQHHVHSLEGVTNIGSSQELM